MYRVFCESYENYIRHYEDAKINNEYRFSIAKPFGLIRDVQRYMTEKTECTLLYRQLSDLLYFMAGSLERYPKMGAFLWTLEARGIEGRYYGVVSNEDLEEQTKLANMFLNLLYWEDIEH